MSRPTRRGLGHDESLAMAWDCMQEGAPFLFVFDGSDGVVWELDPSQVGVLQSLAASMRRDFDKPPVQ